MGEYRSAPPAPVGESVLRSDAVGKVTGTAIYTADIRLPRLAHAAVVRSDRAHARIIDIDVSAASRRPGVLSILTAVDLKDVELYYGHFIPDHPLLADGVVRYSGEAVAIVAAESAAIAAAAAADVIVEYEPLAYVDCIEDAIAAPAGAIVHPERTPDAGTDLTNVCSRTVHEWGDPEAAAHDAALTLRGTFRFPDAYAYAMEPYTAIASWDDRRLTVWSCAQHPFIVRTELAGCFGLPLSAVRVIVPYIGGGYGSKSFTKIEPMLSAVAMRVGRPVRLVLSIDESILTTRVDGARVDVCSSFDAEGRILARTARVLLNTGAYAESSPGIAEKAAKRLVGPYRVPAARVESCAIYTNTPPASSMRGFGAPQVVWAAEQQLDEAAERLGLDPFTIRLRNVLAKGEPPWPGARGMDCELDQDLEILRAELGDDQSRSADRAIGLAISASDAGFVPVSTAVVRMHADGSVTIASGSTEMGQGSETALQQIVAAALGVQFDRVQILQGDTGIASFEMTTGASRTTTLVGRSLLNACDDLRHRLRTWLSELIGVDVTTIESAPGANQFVVDGREYPFDEVIRKWFGGTRGEVLGFGEIRPFGEFEAMPPFWEIGCVGVEVCLDPETGVAALTRLVTVGDVGCAINPRQVEAQELGAATMGIGLALFEELHFEEGILTNGNLFDYRVPRASDIPPTTSRIAERGDGIGPFGAKGSGEGSLNPVAAAVANALRRLVGQQPRQAPMTPFRLWSMSNGRSQADASDW